MIIETHINNRPALLNTANGEFSWLPAWYRFTYEGDSVVALVTRNGDREPLRWAASD